MGVWGDHRPSSPGADFAKRTIIYGFNGTGKTSISRIFSSLEAQALADGLGKSATFQIQFSDGSLASNVHLDHPLGNHLLVFNSDFVSRNFKWEEGAAEPIFHIDELNIEKVTELRQLEQKLEQANAEDRAAKTRRDEADKAFKEKGTEIGGRIRDTWGRNGYTQQFNRTNVDSEYSKREFTSLHTLEDSKIDELRTIIRQPEPNPKFEAQFDLPQDFESELKGVCEILARDFVATLTADLAAHPAMLQWVAEGHSYHEDHELDTCLYCGSNIHDHRKATLSAIFSETWSAQENAIAEAIQWCAESRATFRIWLQESRNARLVIQPTLTSAFDEADKAFNAAVIEAGTAIKELQEAIEARRKNPLKKSEVPERVENLLTDRWKAGLTLAIEKIVAVISEHNLIHDQFQNRKKDSVEALKAHVLFDEQTRFRDLKRKAAVAEEESQQAADVAGQLGKVVLERRNAIRQHGKAPNQLNQLLQDYLGHSSIRLAAKDEGYQLVRADGSIAQNLSEGEKTALTFCFFLTQFSAEGRDRNKLVVVIDDPVSSLDGNAVTYALGLMKKHTNDVAQVILLTHNLKFMDMAKRVFNLNKLENKRTAQGLLFVDCRDIGKGVRQSSLERMPLHLAKHETEYQYLFSVVFDAVQNGKQEYLWMLPNATRKLLEIFLAFAAPDKIGFSAPLFADSKLLEGLDQAEVTALERVCQMESHGDLDGMISRPVLTLEQSQRAASGALKCIRARDLKHYDAMVGLVST